ncbi:MAG: glycosyltransferase [Methylococcaceae bacterium]|nr:glycosyltransferase [Methylococcaceae bacterium]
MNKNTMISRESGKKRIVVYSHDTFGLGNIRRMLAICKHLVDSDPKTSVLILSGSPMLHAFRIPQRIDYIKLPCLSRNTEGEYQAKFLDVDYGKLVRLRSNLILNSILDFDPDLILVDKKPLGVSDELGTALELLQRRGHRAKLVLLLRDILDSPASTIRVWQKNGYHDIIRSFYDQVLVVGSPDIFDTGKEYQFPTDSRAKTRYCGYIARERSAASGDQLRAELGLAQTDRLVFVTVGGGEDGAHVLQCYLEGLHRQPLDASTKSLLVCGPEMGEKQRRGIVEMAVNQPNVIVLEFAQDMMAVMDAADVVVCMGGYNTVCELLTLRKRAVIVPRVKPVLEQWIRAERLAQLGLLRAIHPSDLTPDLLLATVAEELDLINVHRSSLYQINMDGLPAIADALNGLLYPAAWEAPGNTPVTVPVERRARPRLS